MFTDSIKAIGTSTRELIGNWRAMAVLATIYALLLATLYLLVSTREASIFQVVLTLVLAIAAPVLFFVLQAVSANYPLEMHTASLIQRSLKDFGKLVVVSLPLILLTLLVIYLLGRMQARFGIAPVNPDEFVERAREESQRPIVWSAVIFATLRYLLLGLVLPISLMHLWLAVTRKGLMNTIRQAGHYLAGAFKPESLLIYVVGFIVFALLPYLLLFRAIKIDRAWLEIGFLVVKLGVVFTLTLFGWVITMNALEQSGRKELQAVGSEDS